MGKVLGIIPSRIGSTRLPRKPLADILGKTLVQRTYDSCKKSLLLDDVIVATDSQEIYDHVEAFGGKAEMTGEHNSGTSRVIEVANKYPEYESYLNIQGDHPIISVSTIDRLVMQLFIGSEKPLIVTPVYHLSDMEDVLNPSIVKAVFNKYGEALYFSRNRIPFCMAKDISVDLPYWKHLGLYGFNKLAITSISNLEMSEFEKLESLEQLTWLWHKLQILCCEVDTDILSVDVPEDLERVKNLLLKEITEEEYDA